MKRIIVASLLALVAATPAYAGWLKEEKPCGARCGSAAPIGPAQPAGPFLHQNTGNPNLVYESRSQSVIQSRFGTSVINGTYRIYRR